MRLRRCLFTAVLLLGMSPTLAAGFDLRNPNEAIEAGHAALRQDAYLQAVNILEQSLLANPDDPAMHHHLGIAYYKSKAYDKALEHLHRALELAPENAESHYALGVVQLARAGELSALRVAGAMKTAIRHFENAIQQAPEHAPAHFYLAQILLKAPAIAGGNKERALELNARLKELSPLFHEVINSALATMAEDYEKAEQILLKVHREAPDNTLLNYSLLAHYHERNDCATALDFGQRFLAAPREWDDTDPAGVHLTMAECQQRLGSREQSLQHYAQALTYNKSEKFVRRVQAAVRELEEPGQ